MHGREVVSCQRDRADGQVEVPTAPHPTSTVGPALHLLPSRFAHLGRGRCPCIALLHLPWLPRRHWCTPPHLQGRQEAQGAVWSVAIKCRRWQVAACSCLQAASFSEVHFLSTAWLQLCPVIPALQLTDTANGVHKADAHAPITSRGHHVAAASCWLLAAGARAGSLASNGSDVCFTLIGICEAICRKGREKG